MTDRRKPLRVQALAAGWALDIARLRVERIAADDRLERDRDEVDRHMQVHAVELLRVLARLYGTVALDDEPTLLPARTEVVEP